MMFWCSRDKDIDKGKEIVGAREGEIGEMRRREGERERGGGGRGREREGGRGREREVFR